METTFALWANRSFGWGPEQIGWIFFYIGVLLAALQGGAIGKLSQALRRGAAGHLRRGVIGIGLLVLALAGSLWSVLVATGLLSIGMGLLNPSVTSLISRLAGADERGGIMGVSQSASSLARILGPRWRARYSRCGAATRRSISAPRSWCWWWRWRWDCRGASGALAS